ncbi:RNA polymerase sigma factor [Dactylosporangium sp. NPDC051541]|uniref:RNA polymerase sigma factor n=1 Tax=Dactylosporangium sp. NPDC051541 TaxID=3363977 RepID=UPI0037A37A63
MDELADDATLVAAMRTGEPSGWEGVYRRYAARLLTYARTLVHGDDQTAADALHDAFLNAREHIDQLRTPDQLRPWLYAIVRNECHRQTRARSRNVPLDAIDEPVAADVDLTRPVAAAQVRELVHAAADTLSPGDREVVYLAIQHDLSAPMVGRVLGLDTKNAHARLSRARGQLERALGALLVARGGSATCPELAGLLEGWTGNLTPQLRKRVARHADSCDTCTELRREQLSPAALLAGYAPVFLPLDEDLWPNINASLVAFEIPADTNTIEVQTGTVYNTGDFRPLETDNANRRRRALTLSGAALILLLMLGVAFWAFTPTDNHNAPQANTSPRPSAIPVETVAASTTPNPPTATTTTSATATRSVPPPSPPQTPTPATTTTTTTTATTPAAPAPSPSPPAPGAMILTAPFTVTAYGTTPCDGAVWTLLVSATTDTALSAATVTWTTPDGASHSQPLMVSGQYAATEVRGLQAATATWIVRATATDGRTASSITNTARRPC